MDILALLNAKGIEVETKGGDEYAIICPNQGQHQDGQDSIASFNINIAKCKAHCFACGLSMNEVGLTQWLMGDDLDETQLRALKLRSSMKKITQESELTLVDLDAEFLFPPGEPWSTDGYRGVSLETYQKLGAIKCEQGRYANRICLPIQMNGKLLGVDARALGDENPKYLRPKGCNAKEWLFPFDYVGEIIKQRSLDYVIIAEGLFHALRGVDALEPVCCYFGANNFSPANVMQLLDLGVSEVVIFPDRDDVGLKVVDSLHEMLREWFIVSVACIDNLEVDTKASLKKGKLVYQDLGDLIDEEIRWSLNYRVLKSLRKRGKS